MTIEPRTSELSANFAKIRLFGSNHFRRWEELDHLSYINSATSSSTELVPMSIVAPRLAGDEAFDSLTSQSPVIDLRSSISSIFGRTTNSQRRFD